MKISSKDYRVQEGDTVSLKKWPTLVDPVYTSKEHYREILQEHVAQLSAQQELLCGRTSMPFAVFQAMDAAGKDGAISHVMSGVNPQGCQVFSFKHPSATAAAARFPLAHHARSAGTWTDRHLQPVIL